MFIKNKFLFTKYRENQNFYVPAILSKSLNPSFGLNNIRSCYKKQLNKSSRAISPTLLESLTFPQNNSFIYFNPDGFNPENYKLELQKLYFNTINKLSEYMKENFPNSYFEIITDSFNPLEDIIENVINLGNGDYNVSIDYFIKMKNKVYHNPKHIIPNGIFPFVPKVFILK